MMHGKIKFLKKTEQFNAETPQKKKKKTLEFNPYLPKTSFSTNCPKKLKH